MSTPATDWKEVIPEGEEARFIGYAEYLRDLQHQRESTGRGLHTKANLGLEAELVIDDGLPEHARHGLGARPGKYKAYLRFSNGGAGRLPDKKGDIRGFALKVVGVEGKKVIPGMESARTQDFLCINHQVTAVGNADEFLALVKGLQSPVTLLPRMISAAGFFRAFKLLKQGGDAVGVKIVSVACTPYYSAAPLCWGPYAVKVSFQPRAQLPPGATRGDSPGYLGEELTSRVKAGPVVWDFRVQFYTDPKATPIEQNDQPWVGEWLKVGTLTVPQQDPTGDRGSKVSALIEKMSFDPWHALVEHKPLGNMMRARNHAYRLSTQERKAAPEPDGSESFG